MTKDDIAECTEIFKEGIDEQVNSWLHEYESWGMMREDGKVNEEQIEYIQNTLSLVDCVIKTK